MGNLGGEKKTREVKVRKKQARKRGEGVSNEGRGDS